VTERRSSWIHDDNNIALYLSDILFWVVTSDKPEVVSAWWDSGEMPYPESRDYSKLS